MIEADVKQESIVEETVPKILFKVLSPEAWEESQSMAHLKLDAADDAFIHFSTQDQLPRILSKFWSGKPYVVLQIETDKLEGRLVYETNPGGSGAKYYHLYEGEIPLDAVIKADVISS